MKIEPINMKLEPFRPDEGETVDEFVERAREYATKAEEAFRRRNDPVRRVYNALRYNGSGSGEEHGAGMDSDKIGWDRDVIAKNAKLGRGETDVALKELVKAGKVECFYGKDWYLYRRMPNR